MRRLWIALLCALILLAVPAAAQPEAYSSYTIEATFDPNRHTISGRETVAYLNDSDETLSALYFLLLPNYDRRPNPHLDPSYIDGIYPDGFDPAWTRIRAVTDVEGTPLRYELQQGPPSFQTYSLDDTVVRVELAEPLPPGERATVVVHFTTKFPHTFRGDEGHFRDVYAWRFGWNPVAVPAEQLIDGEYVTPERPYYRYVLPAALYELTLILPREYQAAIGTDHQEIIDVTEGEKTVHAWGATPVRSIPLSVSPDFKIYRFPHPEIEMIVYYLPGHEEAARLIASYAAESLDYYRRRWGEYPHRRLLMVETPSVNASFSGAAGDALVLLNRQFFGEKDLAVAGFTNRLLDYLVAHEIAHQWWGVGIGVDWNAENVLSEGLAQYFSITYFEDKYGEFGPNVFRLEREGLLERFVEFQFGYVNLREHLQGELPYLRVVRDRFDEALIKPMKDVKFYQATPERLYNKGYMTLRALAGLIGQEAMDELLRVAYGRFLHQAITSAHFEALAEVASGRELDAFFSQAVHQDTAEGEGEGRAPYVDYAIEHVTSRKRADGSYESRVTLIRHGPIRLPVDVVATTRTGGEQTASWTLEEQTSPEHVLVLETPNPLARVEVDPKHMTPDINRLNNGYELDGLPFIHRKVKLLPTGENALPLDAYLIRINALDQVIEGGYLLDHRWWLGDRFAAFVKDLGRGSSLGAIAALLDGTGLIGQLSYDQAFYSHPTTGLQGRFWEASDRLGLTVLRRPDATGRPSLDKLLGATGRMATVLGMSWTHQGSVTDRAAWWISLLDDPSAFLRLEVGGRESVRLAPNVYTSIQASFGWGQGELGIFHFTLGELASHSEADEYPYAGKIKLWGALDLGLPFQREMNYNLLNVAMLHRIDERFYVQAGNTWDDVEGLARTSLGDLKAEIGAEFTLSGSTLGGLFPWQVTLGVAFPLPQIGEGEVKLHQYLRISTPFF